DRDRKSLFQACQRLSAPVRERLTILSSHGMVIRIYHRPSRGLLKSTTVFGNTSRSGESLVSQLDCVPLFGDAMRQGARGLDKLRCLCQIRRQRLILAGDLDIRRRFLRPGRLCELLWIGGDASRIGYGGLLCWLRGGLHLLAVPFGVID